MEDVAVTAGSALTLVAILVAYTGVGWAAGGRLRLGLRSDEALALGAVLVCLLCVVGYLASRVLTALFTQIDGTTVTVPLTWVIVAVVAVPVITAVLMARRAWRSGAPLLPNSAGVRATGRWALPALLLTLLATVMTLSFGAANTFRTDSAWRTDAVKELVWANSTNIGRTPSLPSENPKYTGYLTTRATVTAMTGAPPWRPNLAWVVFSATAMATAIFALVRNVGMGSYAALGAVVIVPLLGGDAFRFGYVSDARGVAAMVALAGLALLARAVTITDHRRSVAAAGGCVCGAAALMHVQYLVIVASLLVPALVIAVFARRRFGSLWREIGIATAAACAVMTMAVPQALSFGTSSIEEAANERSATELVALLRSGEVVWPPQEVKVDVPMLYVAPYLYVLHPRVLTDGVWGDRTSPLLLLVGLVAALLLVRRRMADPFLAVLILGAVAAPFLILFNPLVFPVFAKYFASYRAEYIGFEFAFLGIAALITLLRARAGFAVFLAVVATLASVPVIRATQDSHQSLSRFNRLVQAPDQREWKEVETDTRYGDLLIAEGSLYPATGALGRRRSSTPELLGIANPLDPAAEVDQVREDLLKQDGSVVFLHTGKLPVDSPLERLIRSGAIRRVERRASGAGLFHREVHLGRSPDLQRP